MITRRKFLQTSAAVLPATAFLGRTAFAAAHIPIGVQLYTVRDIAEHDLPAVLKQIRGIGYEEVEAFGGSYTMPAAQLRRTIQDAGLRVPSGHFNYEGLSEKFEYAKELGLSWIVCPMLPPALGGSLDGFRTAAKQFNEFGRRAKELGMGFAFHNHDYEFRDYGGKTGYDVLLSETDPDLVFFEMDCYWIAQAGHDPVRMLERLGHRVRLIHLKDRKPGFPSSFDMGPSSAHFAPVGQGNIDWKAVLDTAQRLHINHYFVEQDNTYGHPIESIRASYEYLRQRLP
jgi:sugar phosphate isomerase/epimerase